MQQIVNDAERQPGALPLVQHSLAELFDRRRTNTITRAEYLAAGGMREAIGRRAEALYGELDADQRDDVRRVFLALVNVNEDREDTRRRVRRSELEQQGLRPDELDGLLGEFGRHRLLTFDRDPASRTPTVEVAHEALLEHWPRLRGWIDAARDDLLTRRRVAASGVGLDRGRVATPASCTAAAASTWPRPGRRTPTCTSPPTSAGSSPPAARRPTATRTARRRRRRLLVGALVVALVVTSSLGVFAMAQRATADHQARDARARQLASDARLAIDEDPERAVLLAMAAMTTTPTPLPEAVSALQMATQSTRRRDTPSTASATARSPRVRTPRSPPSTERTPTGSHSSIRRRRTVTMKIDTPLPTDYESLAFDPTGAVVAAGFQGGGASEPAVEQFDVATGRSLGTLAGPAAVVRRGVLRLERPLARRRRRHRRRLEHRAVGPARRRRADHRRTGPRLPLHPGDELARGRGRGHARRLVVYDLQPDGTFAEARRFPRPDVPYNDDGRQLERAWWPSTRWPAGASTSSTSPTGRRRPP